MAKPIRALELHFPMTEFLIMILKYPRPKTNSNNNIAW